MSMKALNWVLDLVLPDHGFEKTSKSAVKFVLVALANHANEKHESWVSLPTVSHYTGLDERTVRRALARAVELGLTERRLRPGKSDIYTLKVDTQNGAQPPQYGPPSISTPPNIAPLHGGGGPPSMVAPTPLHDGGANLLNPIEPHDARARPVHPQPLRLPDTAKWATRLADYRPWEGKAKWTSQWGPPPDSHGTDNPIIPRLMLQKWRADAAAARKAMHEARQDGAMGAPCNMSGSHSS